MSLIDVPPTLLDIAGLPIPSQMQGRSLVKLVGGNQPSWPDDVFVQISESQTGRAVRTSKWKYGVDSVPHGTSTPHADQYVEQYLYDLEADPYELTNLAGKPEFADVATEMQGRLKRWMKIAGEPDAVITRT